MKRTMILAAVAALLVLTALPAAAQGPYPPVPDDTVVPPAEVGDVETTTPCSTILVRGDDWGPGTEIFIDREFDGEGCSGEGNPDDVEAELGDGTQDDEETAASSSASSASSPSAAAAPFAQTQQVTVAEDGTFTAQVVVPAEVAGDYTVTVRGTDLSGQAKEQTFSYDVVPTANFVPATTTESTQAQGSTPIALIAIVAALVLAVGFNAPSLVARLRR
ncbi:hypothetical protein [Euzebya sp.]|uniref:hypothetical protein n=1 Tax=Euzebya sp. TaxID=1971409 RepID=UPI003511178D